MYLTSELTLMSDLTLLNFILTVKIPFLYRTNQVMTLGRTIFMPRHVAVEKQIQILVFN